MHGFSDSLIGVQKVVSAPPTGLCSRTAPQGKIGHARLAAEGGRWEVLQGATDDVEQGAKALWTGLLKRLPKTLFRLGAALREWSGDIA
jgi:hypothetical protein